MWLSWLSQLIYELPAKNLTTKSLTKCQLTRYFTFPLILLFLYPVFPAVLCDDFTVSLGFEINAFDGENNKYWVSKNGFFAFGFLDIDVDVNEYVVGIKYILGDKSANLPVWTVGGGLRVSSNSTFKLAMDGSLVLIDNLSKITMWSSNTSNLGVEKATLLDNGNFVLLGNKNEVVWESFGSPTNTLLPGQSLRYPQNLRALSTNSISSYYSLVISGELKLVWEHNVTYWRSPPFSSSVARFDPDGVFGLYDDSNKAVWFVTSTDYGDPSVTLRHLRIDRDGNLRIYSWDSASRVWKPVWQAVEDQCSVFGSCGLYSVCGYDSSGPVCGCLYSDPLRTGVDSGGVGCRRMVDLGNCKMRASVWEMKRTVLYGLYPSHDFELSLSESGCKEFCSNDTGCIAATSMNDGSGRCTIKRTTFISGYKNPYVRAVSFLKVCSVPQAVAAQGAYTNNGGPIISSRGVTSEKGSRRKVIRSLMLVVLLTVLVILSIQILVFLILYRKRRIKVRSRIPFGRDAKMNPHYSVLVRLSSEEIKELTDDFADRIGTSVFRGALPNKMPIVAKVLKDMAVSEKEFRVTVSTLSGTHHRNLVSVKGFCFEQAVKCLLYEYVPNGSLDKWLFDAGENRVEQIWQRKVDIAVGIARGLAYLHLECQKCITHGNLKPENVLLDENLVPKLTDFGLQDLHAKQTASSSESPSERDIYALGRMFLQIITCKREVAGENVETILEQVSRAGKIVDGDSLDSIERMVRISFWCMLNQPFLRPSIGEVVKVLEGTLSVDRPPSRLASRRGGAVETEILEAEC